MEWSEPTIFDIDLKTDHLTSLAFNLLWDISNDFVALDEKWIF